jgi:hypothetical protein
VSKNGTWKAQKKLSPAEAIGAIVVLSLWLFAFAFLAGMAVPVIVKLFELGYGLLA